MKAGTLKIAEKHSSPYSQLKVAWHPDQLSLLKKGFPKPVHVQLILSDLCNQDCHFCAYRMSNGLSTELFSEGDNHNPNRQITTEKAEEIIRDCKESGVKAIQFTGGGEPTVHKDHKTLFALAQSLGIKTALVTNGTRLDPLCSSTQNMEWIRISIDAGTEETYERIRRHKGWNKLWRTIDKLWDYGGRLGAGFVVTNDNFREIPKLARICQSTRIGNLRIGAVFSKEGIHYYKDIEAICDYIKEARTFENESFRIIDLFGRRLKDLESGPPDEPFCGYQHFTTYIGADLSVYRCCNTAYTTRGQVGSIKDLRFRDLVNDQPFDARQCEFCQFRGQNEAINSLLNEPQDVDFV